MATIVTRAGKGLPLTNEEVDANFTNLNNQLATALFGANNLSDLANVSTARSNLGVAIGTNVQAWNAKLDQIAALAPTTDNFIVGNGTAWTLETPAQARTSLGLVIGTNIQAWDADLDSIAALAGTSGFLKKTAANTWALDTNTYLTGITSGQVTTALGYTPVNPTAIGSSIQAWDADLDAIAALAGTSGFLKKTAANTWSLDTSTYLTGITSGQVTTALGFTPYNATNPSGYISSITSGMVTTALGFTPYNATNPSGYITSSSLSSYLPLAGGTLTGQVNTSANIKIGLTTGFVMFHDTANAYMDMVTGNLNLRNGAGALRFTFANAGDFTAVGNVTAYSDETLKTNWRPVGDGFIERLANVKRGIYDRIDGGATQVGVSAQSLQWVLPNAVMTDKDGILSVAYGNAALLSVIEVADELVKLKQYIKSKLG